jgi:predicted DNA-binding protein
VKRHNFFYPEQLIAELRALSAKTGLPMSELIRRAIAEYLEKMKGKS